MTIDQRLLDAYLDYSGEQARQGILDCSLTDQVAEDTSLEQRMREQLQAAGRWPTEDEA